ncbi:MAG: response regulator [Deltaproteobacteria bacterium]|nr:response regulator [Deltaproteobacteria bacterium]
MKLKHVVRANLKELFFIFTAFMLMVAVSLYFFAGRIEKQIFSNADQLLSTAEAVISSGLREFEITLFDSAAVIQDKLAHGEPVERIAEFLRELGRRANSPNGGRPGFINIYCRVNGQWLYGSGHDRDLDKRAERLGAFWRKAGPVGGNMEMISGPYHDEGAGGSVITMSLMLIGHKGMKYGLLAMDMDMTRIKQYVRSLQFSAGGYGVLLDQNLVVMAYPDEQFNGTVFGDLSPAHAQLAENLLEGRDIHAARMVNTVGEKMVSFLRRMHNGWYIGISTPTRAYYKDLYQMGGILVFIGIISSSILSLMLLRLGRDKIISEEKSESKSSFLARMNHEIRTPLNVIIGLAEVELQKDALPRDTLDNIDKIYNSGAVLLGIVNDVLDISKIESGKFKLVNINYDVPSLINDVVHLNMLRIGDKDIAFKLSIDETIPRVLHGDDLRLKQILNNLLSNAFKYTREGVVSMRIKHKKLSTESELVFVVKDTGIGIKKEEIGNIFVAYSQLDPSANRLIEGTGLGLAITKNLVEMMGGSISLSSEYGKGSSFVVRLRQRFVDNRPIGRQTAHQLQNFQFMDSRRFKGKNLAREYMPYGKVLVVDDMPTNIDVTRGLLAPYGLFVDQAGSGSKAVEMIRARKVSYDLIFMDHMMPVMDGIETVRVIREEIGTDYAREVPIIALTANAMAGNKEMFAQHGFNGFLAKPIDVIQLDAELKLWIRDKQSESTLLQARQAAESKNKSPCVAEAAFDISNACGFKLFDLAEGLRRYGDEDIYLQVLRSYLRHTPPLLDSIRALSRETLPEYALAVHSLKGASHGICAANVASLAEKLEKDSKAGDLDAVLAGNQRLLEAAQELLQELEALLHLHQAEDHRPKSLLAEPDPVLLRGMLEACVRFRLKEMEDILVELEKYQYATGADLVLWLREQTENLEYEAIRARLENV